MHWNMKGAYAMADRPASVSGRRGALPAAVLDLEILVGGMGVEISCIALVAAVANHPSGRMSGSLSATALADVYARRLQLGDARGDIRKAFDAFNLLLPGLASETNALYRDYFIAGGKALDQPFRSLPMGGIKPTRAVQVMTTAATFAHVWLAKQAAPGRPLGVNFLRKIERPLLYGLYGAVLAGADWICMGAGDPSAIPEILDRLSRHESVELPMQVATVPLGEYKISFDPADFSAGGIAPVRRPAFLAILSSHLQAAVLAQSPYACPDGFIMEGPDAGGHNAAPRSKKRDGRGHYVYGAEDRADLAQVAALGLPFWSAGGKAQRISTRPVDGPHRGRQIGTLFALSTESGMDPVVRKQALEEIWRRRLEVVNDAAASPSTYAFKVAHLAGTVSDPAVYAARKRKCNIGHLRSWRPKDGKVVGLCSADDPKHFAASGGAAWRAQGAMCLCNGLMAACGLGQIDEAPLVTLGDLTPVRELQLRLHRLEYSAKEAADFLIGA